MKRIKGLLTLAAFLSGMFSPAMGFSADWLSPGTGVTYTLSSLAAGSTNVTWDSGNNWYLFNDTVIILANDTLNISAGEVLAFQDQLDALVIQGTLNATGTSGNMVVFKSDDGGAPATDLWGGIWASNREADVNLTYCRIESTQLRAASDDRSGSMNVQNCEFEESYFLLEKMSSLTFDGNSIDAAARDEMFSLDGSSISSFSNNKISNAQEYCIENLNPYYLHTLSNNTFDCGNDYDIEIDQLSATQYCIDASRTWTQKADYTLPEGLCTTSASSLSIEAPGASFMFGDTTSFKVLGDLNIDGTTAEPITFGSNGGNTTFGMWYGLSTEGGISNTVTIDNVVWENANFKIEGESGSLGETSVTNSVFDQVSVSILNSDSLSFDGNSVDTPAAASASPVILTSSISKSFSNNRITGHSSDYLIQNIDPAYVHSISNNTLTGSSVADIYVYDAANSEYIESDVEWTQVATYLVDSYIQVSDTGKLSITAAGAQFSFDNDYGLYVEGGDLVIDGTTSSYITFIDLTGSGSHTIETQTGSTILIDRFSSYYGGMYVQDPVYSTPGVGKMHITNSRLDNVYLEVYNIADFVMDSNSVFSGSTLGGDSSIYFFWNIQINSFKNNYFEATDYTEYLVNFYPPAYLGAMEGNSFVGADIGDVYLFHEVMTLPCISTPQTWAQSNTHFVVATDFCIADGGSVDITGAGSVFEFEQDTNIESAGSFTAEGTLLDPIIFALTTESGPPYPWYGITMTGQDTIFGLTYVDWKDGNINISPSIGNLSSAVIENSVISGVEINLNDINSVIFDGNSVTALAGSTAAINLTGSTVTSFDSNSIAGSTILYNVYGYPPQSLGNINNNTLTGAATAEFYVYSDSSICAADTQNGTQSDTLFHIYNDLCVGTTGDMTFSGPGSQLRFMGPYNIDVNGGDLSLSGSSGSPLTLRGDGVNGNWDGISMDSGTGKTFSLNYIDSYPSTISVTSSGLNYSSASITNSNLIETATSLKNANSATFNGNIVTGPSSASIIPLDLESSVISSVSLNNITGSPNDYLITNVDPAFLHNITGNTFSGAGVDDIKLYSPSLNCINSQVNWTQNASYYVDSQVCINGSLSVNLPGTFWTMTSNALFQGAGSLSITGTPGNRVALFAASGSWGGINLTTQQDPALTLDQVDMDNASISVTGAQTAGDVGISNSQLTLIDTTITDSDSVAFTSNIVTVPAGSTVYGLDLSGSVVTAITGNNITGSTNNHLINNLSPVYLDKVSGNTLSGISGPEIRLFNQSPTAISGTVDWSQSSDYQVGSTIIVGASGNVDIDILGSTWGFETGKGINCAGDLAISGQAGNQITLTSSQPGTPGNWNGITISSGGSFNGTRAFIRYANIGINADSPSAFTATYNQITEAGTNAMYLQSMPASTEVSANYMEGTVGPVLRLNQGSGKFENNVISAENNNNILNEGDSSNPPDFGGGALSSAGGNEFNHIGSSGYVFYNNSPDNISAMSNYWSAVETEGIQGYIYDYYDNASYGIVDFTNFTFGYFQSMSATPSYLWTGDTLTISFTTSTSVTAGPFVTVAGQATSLSSNIGNDYVYTYSTLGSSPESHGTNYVFVQASDDEGIVRFRAEKVTIVFDSDKDLLCDSGMDITDGATIYCVESEALYGTSISNTDTDGDGIEDGDEVITYNTDPASDDTDEDGLDDYLEAITVGCLMASTADSDGDGLCDGDTTVGLVCTAGEDWNIDGAVGPGETNPCNADSDSDSLTDGYEVNYSPSEFSCGANCASATGCSMQTYNGHDYMFCNSSSTWSQARDFCLKYGGDMVAVDDSFEKDFLETYVISGNLQNTWIGYNDLDTEGVFTWSHGTPNHYTNWNGGQPSDAGAGAGKLCPDVSGSKLSLA